VCVCQSVDVSGCWYVCVRERVRVYVCVCVCVGVVAIDKQAMTEIKDHLRISLAKSCVSVFVLGCWYVCERERLRACACVCERVVVIDQ